ncbi:MAG: ATP-binding protein [Rubrobacteraceae bacterium]
MTGKENTGATEPISLKIPSRPEYVLLARLVVTQVGQLAGLEQDEIYDLKLAVTEAATNVIRHAVVESFEIDYAARGGAVEIKVKDAGGGFDVEGLTKMPDSQGGFGLSVIGSLVDELMLDSAEDGGTQLKMVYRSSSSKKTSNI